MRVNTPSDVIDSLGTRWRTRRTRIVGCYRKPRKERTTGKRWTNRPNSNPYQIKPSRKLAIMNCRVHLEMMEIKEHQEIQGLRDHRDLKDLLDHMGKGLVVIKCKKSATSNSCPYI